MKLEWSIRLLAFFLVFFTVALFFAEMYFKSDAEFFTVIASAFSGVLGALLGMLTGNKPPGSTVTVDQATNTPPAEPKP